MNILKTMTMKKTMAQIKMPNKNYEGCPALFLCENEDTAIVIWITKSEPEYKP